MEREAVLDNNSSKMHLGCGHWANKHEWQAMFAKDFFEARRPFAALKCFLCSAPVTVTAFNMVATALQQVELACHLTTIPKTCLPTSLADFGYRFGPLASLERISSPQSFHFVSETHYSKLGDFIVQEIQNRLVHIGLEEVWLPATGPLRTNVFASRNLASFERVVVIIQGSGAVRAGQWARALCLNEGLDTGSILPYVARLQQRGIGVIVFNPNNSMRVEVDEEELRKKDPFVYWTTQSKQPDLCISSRTPIPGHSRPEEHCVTVFDHFFGAGGGRTGAETRLVIVAHSYGGVCTLALLNQRKDEVLHRLCFVAFTDAVHSVSKRDAPEVRLALKAKAVNWVQSAEPIDARMPALEDNSGCRCVSAGTTSHEATSSRAMQSVFAYIDKTF